LELIRYIHLNPLRARLVKDLKELDKYPWTGHSAILGKRNNPLMPNDQINRMNQTNQIDQINQTDQRNQIDDPNPLNYANALRIRMSY